MHWAFFSGHVLTSLAAPQPKERWDGLLDGSAKEWQVLQDHLTLAALTKQLHLALLKNYQKSPKNGSNIVSTLNSLNVPCLVMECLNHSYHIISTIFQLCGNLRFLVSAHP